MEQVKNFDKMLEKIENYDFVMSKFVMYLCLSLGCFWMIVPLEEKDTFLWMTSYYIFSIGIYCYLKPYLHIGKEKTPVFYVLSWMPVEANEIYKVRQEYLSRMILKITVVSFSLQQVGAVLNHSWGIWNIVYPLVIAGLVWLSGVLYLKMVMKVFL